MDSQKKYQLKGMHMKVSESGEVTGLDPVGNVVVGTYFKIQNGIVGAYKSIEQKFVDAFLEPVEEEGREE